MEDRYIEVDGARLAWSVAGSGTGSATGPATGSGPLVIVAHGLTMSRAREREQGLTPWDDLAGSGFRVVAYDARGHGHSSGRAVPEDYRWSSLAGDLLALADLLSPDEPVHAIGTSMGTGTILHALTRRPERFRSVALAAPPTAWETRAPQQRVYAAAAADAETKTPAELAVIAAAAPLPPIFAEEGAVPPLPDIDHALLPSVLRGAGTSDLPDPTEVARIRVPALLLAWATDPGHPVSTTERLAELLPDAQAVVAEDVAAIRTWPARAAAFFTAHP
ncbi:pimeloyl-ACP methyl ester carboxylesterase [Microbacterium resistens]|uniref:Pimeloyl-ACP methyl ester carboxylesterase n=1 Tax=Microbacterium resistens TaxID=156977 RepID=A0ABU1SBT0_9MICO|nr:alpha/beta fold hydrolase [Microbacterium resistens]MDR6867062.1 pimeloyl-ACP methyl ester carboxylesterase [Microbacterium resistens]